MSSNKKVSSAKKQSKRKKIVVDTNVILFDFQSVTKFPNYDIIIPMTVIEEIDKFKKDNGENGRNARQFSRFIDALRAKGDLIDGVELASKKSKISIIPDVEVKQLDSAKADNRILSAAIYKKAELISKDINLRIKADIHGVIANDYEPDSIDHDKRYEGYLEISLSSGDIEEFYNSKKLETSIKLNANQYVIMKDKSSPNNAALGRFDKKRNVIVPLISNYNVFGMSPKNVEQCFALDALLNDEIKFVSLIGMAGSGKTLISIAAALYKSLDESKYNQILVSRPIMPLGKDIGYLPGTMEEKVSPYMQPIIDNVEFLFGADKRAQHSAQELFNQNIIKVEPMTYIRGRSITNKFFLLDESQNTSPHEIKAILTRMGEGTKVVITGDIYQIDNPYLDSSNNGLAYAADKFKDSEIAAHITLVKGERSELAELAALLL